MAWAVVSVAFTIVILGISYFLLVRIDLSIFPILRPDRLRQNLILDMNDEVVIEGKATNTGLNCRYGEEHCVFQLIFDIQNSHWSVLVVYSTNLNASKEPCSNTKASQVGSLVNNGDKIEVFGKYHKGSIYTCDSESYYIRKIQ